MTKTATVILILAIRITNINNSLTTMTGMRAMLHHFFIGLICQNCLVHSQEKIKASRLVKLLT